MIHTVPSSRARRNSLDAALQRLVEAEFDGLDKAARKDGHADADVVEFVKPEEVKPQPALSDDEEAFVSRTIEFLKERKNADILIDEIARRCLHQPVSEAAAAIDEDLEGERDA
jgi:hypothetical protein